MPDSEKAGYQLGLLYLSGKAEPDPSQCERPRAKKCCIIGRAGLRFQIAQKIFVPPPRHLSPCTFPSPLAMSLSSALKGDSPQQVRSLVSSSRSLAWLQHPLRVAAGTTHSRPLASEKQWY